MVRILYPRLFAPIPPIAAPPETVTLDKWFQPAAQPFPARRPPLVTGAVAPFAPAVTAVPADGWLQPPPPPRRAPPRRLAADGVVAPFLQQVTPEIVLADKWMQPPSQPTRRRSFAAALGPPGGFVAVVSPPAPPIRRPIVHWID